MNESDVNYFIGSAHLGWFVAIAAMVAVTLANVVDRDWIEAASAGSVLIGCLGFLGGLRRRVRAL